jgi:hypothetical protein
LRKIREIIPVVTNPQPLNRQQKRKMSKEQSKTKTKTSTLNYSQQSNNSNGKLNASQQSVPSLDSLMKDMKQNMSIPPDVLKQMEMEIETQKQTIGTSDVSVTGREDKAPKRGNPYGANYKYEKLRIQLYIYGEAVLKGLIEAGNINPRFLMEAGLWGEVVTKQGKPTGNMIDHLIDLAKQYKWAYELLNNLVTYSVVGALITDALTLAVGTMKVFEVPIPNLNPFAKKVELNGENTVQSVSGTPHK